MSFMVTISIVIILLKMAKIIWAPVWICFLLYIPLLTILTLIDYYFLKTIAHFAFKFVILTYFIFIVIKNS